VGLSALKTAVEEKEGVSPNAQVLVAAGRVVSTPAHIAELAGATVYLTLGLCGGGRSRGKGKKAANFFGPIDQPDEKLLAAREKWKEKHGGDDEDGSDDDEEEEFVAPVKKKSAKPVVLDQYGKWQQSLVVRCILGRVASVGYSWTNWDVCVCVCMCVPVCK
jgi:hypothetical protein